MKKLCDAAEYLQTIEQQNFFVKKFTVKNFLKLRKIGRKETSILNNKY